MNDNNKDFEEENDIDPEENLRLDNQIKKLNLELSGAKFMAPQLDNLDLPPEIEGQMLDYILEFNQLQKTAKLVKISSLLKHPIFEPIANMSDKEVEVALASIHKKLFRKGIALMTIKPISARDLYHFITTDFMNVEVFDKTIKGIVRQFVYEDFCPSDEFLLDKAIFKFKTDLLDAEEIRSDKSSYYPESLLQKVELFEMIYDDTEIITFDILRYEIKKTVANVYFVIDMNATLCDSLKSHKIAGEGMFKFKKRKGSWIVIDYLLPSANS